MPGISFLSAMLISQKKVCALRLAIVFGRVNENSKLNDSISEAEKSSKTGLRNLLQNEISKLRSEGNDQSRDGAHGMLGAEYVKCIAQVPDRPIVMIESSQNNIRQQEEILKDLKKKKDSLPASLIVLEEAKQLDTKQIAEKRDKIGK
jgi:hypothetical protein